MKQGLTLTQLAQELERQVDAKVDYLTPTDQIHFLTGYQDGTPRKGYSEIDLIGTDVAALSLNEYAHGQMASRLAIPRKYYDRIRFEIPSLLDENVNKLLRYHPDKPADQWMVRTLDSTARAFLSDRYRDIDNYDVAQVVLPILGDIPDVQIQSCALTDTKMYIKATTPRIAGSVVGDEVCAGVVITNSEVGASAFKVEPLVFRLVCLNGMVVGSRGEGMMRQIHLGRQIEADANRRIFRDETRRARDRAFLMEAADVVRAAVDEVNFRGLIAEMTRASETTPVTDVKQAVQVIAKRESLTDGEADGVLNHLAAGGDLSQWGMINAVTRLSQDVENYDRASELEAVGGKILAYAPREWDAVATAKGPSVSETR